LFPFGCVFFFCHEQEQRIKKEKSREKRKGSKKKNQEKEENQSRGKRAGMRDKMRQGVFNMSFVRDEFLKDLKNFLSVLFFHLVTFFLFSLVSVFQRVNE